MVGRCLNRVALSLLGAAALVGGIDWVSSYRAPPLLGSPVYRAEHGRAEVALTFDDGPRTPSTRQILDLLDRHGARATFFVVGRNAHRHPELVQEILARGHQVGNHGWSHARLVFRSAAVVREEIERTDQLLRELGVAGEIPFRAPHGRKLLTLPAVLAERRQLHVLFDVVPGDWQGEPAEAVVERVLTEVRPGSIILLHDGGGDRRETVRATALLLPALAARGLSLVTVAELLRPAAPGAVATVSQ
jgi:peptidoglycan/xylan/chitin deacetylase (PgdA/CDA1 family)